MIDKMLKLGFVERKSNPKDRRKVGIVLSNKAKRVLSARRKQKEGVLKKFTDKLSREDCLALKIILTKLVE